MSNKTRRIKVKFKNELGEKLKEIFGTSELELMLEDSATLYKTLTKAEDIEDWDCDDQYYNTESEPETKEATLKPFRGWDEIVFSSEIDIIRLINIFRSVSRMEEFTDLGPSNPAVKNYIINSYYNKEIKTESDFSFMGLKTILEFKYSGNLEAAREDLLGKIVDENNWSMFKESTPISAISCLLK